MAKTNVKNPIRPYLVAFLIFISVSVVTQYLTCQQYKINEEKERTLLLHELNRVNDKFRNILSYNLIATNTLALIYKENGTSKNFDSIASQLLRNNKYIDALQLTENGIITNIYPLKGFEKAIGLSAYRNPTLLWEAKTAIKKKEIFFTGPRKLLSGDIGILGKAPVFIHNKPTAFITSCIKLPTIKKVIGLDDNADKNQFTYTLIKKMDNNHYSSFNLSDVERNKKSKIVSIDIPRGNWTLQVAYSKYHHANLFPYTLCFFGILISLFAAFFTYHRILERNFLKKDVSKKNYLLTERLKELSTIYQIETILSDENPSIEQNLTKTVNLIPNGFQFPQFCQARITLAEKKYTTKEYKESDNTITSIIDLPDGHNGTIEVVYPKNPFGGSELSFSQEEFEFIDSIAKKIAAYLRKTFHKEALKHSEEQFRISFENAAVGKAITSLDKKFLTVNKAFCDMLGYSKEELLQFDFTHITHKEDYPANLTSYSELLSGNREAYKTEKRYIHKNGSVVWAGINTIIIKDEKNNPLYFISEIENITEKIESETKFKDLVEKSPVGIFILKDNKHTYVNPKIIEEFGYSEEELKGSPITKLIYEEDLPIIQNFVEKRQQGTLENFKFEVRLQRKDGSVLWAEISSSPTINEGGLAIIGTLVNKTDEKNAYIELKKSEANIKSIFNSTEVSYLLIDKDFKVISFNPHFNQYQLEQTGNNLILNADLIEQIPLEERKKITKKLRGVLQSGRPAQFEEKTYIQSLNQTKYHEFFVSPVKNNETIIGLCIANIDITSKKIMELEREKIINELVIKNRDLEQFSYIISHNMRAPIANLLGLVDLLKDDPFSAEDNHFVREAFEQSATTLDSVVTDVNNILNFKKDHTQTKTNVDLTKIINQIQMELDGAIKKTRAKIEYDFGALSQIYAVETHIHNIFLNLISNSLKYSSENIPPEIKIWSEIDGATILLHFKDNGIGIDIERYKNEIFGLYKRFDHSKEGKGMGLFVVKTQVNDMQGTISVASKLGEGATFSIRLPLTESA